MVPETTTKPTSDGNRHKLLDREVRDMVNAITSRVGDLQKTGNASQQRAVEDEHGVRIITLAGTNTGATMRSELDDKLSNSPQGISADQPDEALGTYVNSNFQSVNNSIMLGSSYNTNDPGVHLEISDLFEHQGGHNMRAIKGKTKDKESAAFKSAQQTDDHSD